MPVQWVCGDSHALCTQLTLDTSGMWGLLLASEVASGKSVEYSSMPWVETTPKETLLTFG